MKRAAAAGRPSAASSGCPAGPAGFGTLQAVHSISRRHWGRRVRNSVYRAVVEQQGIDITMQTATRDLQTLVTLGLLVPHGANRGRYYAAGAVLAEVAAKVRQPRRRPEIDPYAVDPATIGQDQLF